MNAQKYFLIIVVLAMIIPDLAKSQSKSFENILKMSDVSSGALLEGDDIRGYYYFYQMDKAKGGNRIYWLTILDQNLNVVNTAEIEESKHVLMLEAKYNGKNLLFKLLDYKDGRVILLRYSLNGELIKKYETSELTKYEMMMMYGTESDPQKNTRLFDIKDIGFVNVDVSDKGKGFKLNMIPSDESAVNEWSYNTDEDKGLEYGSVLIATDKVVFTGIIKKKNLFDGNLKLFLQGNDLKTGAKIFEVSLTNKFTHQPLTAYYDKNTKLVNLLGIFSDPDEKMIKDNGLGIFRLSVDEKGNFSNQKYLTWANDFSKFVQVSRKGQIGEGKSYVYFHNIVQKPDGSILAIGEQYRKTADAGSIAGSILGSGAALTEITVEDMVLCHFTPDFKINSIEFIEKTESDCAIPSGAGFFSVHLLAHLVKAYGGFDYIYTQNIEKDNAVTIAYLDFVKPEKEKKKWIFGAITVKDGQITKDKMDIGNVYSEDKIFIHQAKPGYILIEEYDKKEKRVDIHLERINY